MVRCKYCGVEVTGRTMCLNCYYTVYSREQYQKHKEKRLAYMKRYRQTEAGKATNYRYKDKTRHGSIRQQILRKHDFKCQRCGKNLMGLSRDTVIHHKDGLGLSVEKDKRNHIEENQELLCRACHASIHQKGNYKVNLSKKQIEDALGWRLSMEKTAQKLGIVRGTLYQKRILYGLLTTRQL